MNTRKKAILGGMNKHILDRFNAVTDSLKHIPPSKRRAVTEKRMAQLLDALIGEDV